MPQQQESAKKKNFKNKFQVILVFYVTTTLMHLYQQGENGQPVKIQELRTFLQTNIEGQLTLTNCIFLTAG